VLRWPEAIVVKDLDCDGIPEIIVADGGYTTVQVLSQSGNTTLSVPYATHYRPHALAVGDIFGSYAPEIAVATFANGGMNNGATLMVNADSVTTLIDTLSLQRSRIDTLADSLSVSVSRTYDTTGNGTFFTVTTDSMFVTVHHYDSVVTHGIEIRHYTGCGRILFDTTITTQTDHYGLSNSDTVHVVHIDTTMITAVTEASESASAPPLSAYPNPAHENITLCVPQALKGEILSIADMSGRIVWTVVIIDEKTFIGLDDFPSGVYLARVKDSFVRFIKD